MALVKQEIPINFGKGLDTKTDDKQVQIGNFLALQNSVFDKQGGLTKRNGFPDITKLPNSEQTTLTTLNDNLLATGSNLYAFNQQIDQWFNRGKVQPVTINTQSLIRSSTTQTSPDTAVAASGLACLVYVDSGSTAYYQISDSTTGQQVVSRVALPATAVSPRVFLLGRYFVITYIATVSAAPHLQFIAIPTANPANPLTATDVSTAVSALAAGYDGVVANNSLYLSWSSTGTTVKIASVSSTLIVSAPASIASHTADILSVVADISGSTAVLWVTFWDAGSTNTYTAAFNQSLNQVLAPTTVSTGITLSHITGVATGNVLTLFYEIVNYYDSTGAYPTHTQTDFIRTRTITVAGVVTSPVVILRSVGLASKAFTDSDSGITYMIVTYGETSQPTYFLVDSAGAIYARLAYSNGGGYAANQVLPTVSQVDGVYMAPYLIKDFLAPVNKGTALPSGTPTTGIYTQTGVNLAQFTINSEGQYSASIADALHLTGGQLWEYDGVKPVEHGFHVWPENVASGTATGSGGLIAQSYYYAFCYEWTDNQGKLHRSAPSIPKLQVTTTGSSTNTLYIPTLRLTYKITPNPVRIVGYRWSTAQQVYYQFTSITSPTLNDPTVDYVTITDANADSAVLGQTLLYTTGGVIENIAAPASSASTLFKNRLWIIDAEDSNLLWYSKVVIQNTPVEMSDLFTLYVAPTTGAQGSTGKCTALGAMDDKLIIFKKSALYYLTGQGPDNTGANNDYTDPVYIASPVGCDNPNSIVLTPRGLMFGSEKGIWLLGRDLSITYVGAEVERYNQEQIMSATAIPDTTQVRFILGNRTTLMYDYYYGQWGTFSNISAISATIYQGAHTYLNSSGRVFQERAGTYVDGSSPVLLSFTTGWIHLAGLQGYERFYYLHLLGTYLSPFKLNVQIAYDYNPSAVQATLVLPDNYAVPYGDESAYGGGPEYGGSTGNVLSARLFPERQKCEAFQITATEVFDTSFDTVPGAGLTLSELGLTVGVKKGTRTQKASQSFG